MAYIAVLKKVICPKNPYYQILAQQCKLLEATP
jgi:hypothetical protein